MLNWKELSDGIYLVKENTTRVNRLNSLIIEKKSEPNILIDANYPFNDIDLLYSEIDDVYRLIFSHGHLDHTAHAFYHEHKYHTPIFCPIQEKEYLTDLDQLMNTVGFKTLNLEEDYRRMVKEYMKYSECEEINTYIPGEHSFESPNFLIKTIHIPGHSPGHTAFTIQSKRNNTPPILYVADIGSHPYYGDLNSDLKKYRKSINKLEQIYFNNEFILIPAHGNYYLQKDEAFFERIREKIDSNEKKILGCLKKNEYKSIEQIVEERILTPPERIFEPIKNLYYLWDGGMILNHLRELTDKNVVQEIKGINFLHNKYKLK